MVYFNVLALTVLLFVSCNENQHTDFSESINTSHSTGDIDPIDKALEALNKIQVSGDGKMMLYMTFPNIEHQECLGQVQTYTISRKEFKKALLEVMKENNKTISEKERIQLASTAAAPAESFSVKQCSRLATTSNKPTRQGTWIISNIFETSDLVIKW